jgi:hypothetical protein
VPQRPIDVVHFAKILKQAKERCGLSYTGNHIRHEVHHCSFLRKEIRPHGVIAILRDMQFSIVVYVGGYLTGSNFSGAMLNCVRF